MNDIDRSLVINTYVKVYGEEYRDIISKRINSSMIFMYDDPIFIEDHVKFLRHCKRNMYRVQLLIKLGINIKDEYKLIMLIVCQQIIKTLLKY